MAFTGAIPDDWSRCREGRSSYVIGPIRRAVNQHPDALVRLLVALFLAKEEQLGYDPLVTRLSDGSYVYELPPDGERPSSVYYRTVALLSQYHSPSLTGRRARVWRVKQVVSPTDPRRVHGTIDRVLKDVLLDATMKTEAEIQQQLFHDIDAFSQDANWRNRDILKEFDQTTIDSIAEALEGGNFRRYFSTIVDKHIDFLSSTLSSPSSPVTSPRNRRCLFVYEYFCTPLYSVPTLGEVFDIVKQCLTALRLMFCAGWVHRDVSPGNILAVRQTPGSPWRVQLSDLEFARRFPDVGAPPSSQITGTPPFMACEIHTSKYLLPPPTLERIPPGGKVPVVPRPKGPVVYHYQHDLESLWWIVLWIVTMRVRQNLPRRFGEAMFLSEAGMRNGLARTTLFSECIADDDMFLESLPPSLESLAVPLENLRYDLYAAYTSRNQEDRINDIGTYSYIMGRAFTLFFDDVGNSRSEWESVDLVVEHDAPYPIRTSTVVSGPHPRPSYPVLTLNNPSPKKRQLQDTDTQGRPAKRARCSPTVNRPVTRSMTRQDGPITRSQSRRLLQIRQGRC
ncbi:other/FunK1 protein kinase [Coprinopsis cinerea okayama7|uniref:Other/FunK1 protein kinase n=1 Tax=Coprinopsis cinerea (strain Okayama-7 / 130 / ATCC MYA-4618 / FGSC 9003) TaxID=240176 RepID=A8NAY8_COPC7|nr:other/FunK1 protein kinase [Coprinopsis cinerea okayama7\|eukprot:XP_001831990.2 other/FunK1 protein kinase [Coprinopsis cinerea okayama7\